MKTLGRRILRILFFVSYPVLVVALVVSLILLFVTKRELNQVNDTFARATTELNADNQNKEVRIDDLRQEFQEMTTEVGDLRARNQDLEQQLAELQQTGYGTLTGKIFPFVTSGTGDFSQYQRVCAESTTNASLQFCRTVSALQQNYGLSVPAGTYRVYAELFPSAAGSALAGSRAYYTEYIKCVQDNGIEKCDAGKKTPVGIEVKAGANIQNVDPIDWVKPAQ